MSVETRSYVEEARREKLVALRQRGIEPFAYRYERTHTTVEACQAFDHDAPVVVRIAGRLVALRGHGKTTFAHIADGAGKVQLYFRRDDLGADAYETVKLLDLGDHLGVEGQMFKTRTGEVTVRVSQLQLLAKALRPLPLGKEDAGGELHGTLADPEMRYRQRYADLAVHPVHRDVFHLRAQVISYLRGFLDARGYVEVETPILQPVYGGALARPFMTHHNTLDSRLYLRIATELYLKRCIIGGLERVYEIGKDFRNEGIDSWHNPEFTMLEFYAAYADYTDVMTETEEMVHGLATSVCGRPTLERFGKHFDLTPPFRRLKYCDLVLEHAGVDVLAAEEGDLRERLRGREIEDLEAMPRGKLVDELFSELVQPALDHPTFVVDFPIELSPLAKPKRGNPALAERFELFIDGRELANAFSELNDPDEQRTRFAQQAAARAAGDQEAHPIDDDYLRALEYGLPPTGGCGVGIDRLMMFIAERPSIRDVILFPTLRPRS